MSNRVRVGLLTALSGVYFVTNLENRAETLAREFETELVEDKETRRI